MARDLGGDRHGPGAGVHRNYAELPLDPDYLNPNRPQRLRPPKNTATGKLPGAEYNRRRAFGARAT